MEDNKKTLFDPEEKELFLIEMYLRLTAIESLLIKNKMFTVEEITAEMFVIKDKLVEIIKSSPKLNFTGKNPDKSKN